MEESEVGFKIETGAEDVHIKQEPLDFSGEYPVSLYVHFFHILHTHINAVIRFEIYLNFNTFHE